MAGCEADNDGFGGVGLAGEDVGCFNGGLDGRDGVDGTLLQGAGEDGVDQVVVDGLRNFLGLVLSSAGMAMLLIRMDHERLYCSMALRR